MRVSVVQWRRTARSAEHRRQCCNHKNVTTPNDTHSSSFANNITECYSIEYGDDTVNDIVSKIDDCGHECIASDNNSQPNDSESSNHDIQISSANNCNRRHVE
jgi:hypothetical protein